MSVYLTTKEERQIADASWWYPEIRGSEPGTLPNVISGRPSRKGHDLREQ